MATTRLCSIPDCGKPHHCKGYCDAHYTRLRRHGDPLSGRTPDGEATRWVHEVALLHTSDDCLKWPFGKNGYARVRIDGKKVIANRYVCELAHGAPPSAEHEAAHSCGKGHEACISPGHLSWKTHKENMADRLVHGTLRRGERHGCAKLTENDARMILALKDEIPRRKLAEKYGVSRGTIGNIHAGRGWTFLSKE
ncbi:hypothetical protein [Rhizobium lentis]|uniref:HNH endonuclease n=1 Tax=Rhizobium lentis TaxID=1138194 RepID=A0ABS7IBQ5_9HYPH|nr:hypothetical protein [Rhizobium lentis]MBX5089334.1 hypothetical protein [Rhizobium lentis]